MAWLSTVAILSVAAMNPGGGQPPLKSMWRALPAVRHGNLAIYPVTLMSPEMRVSSAGYITLDEGLKAGTVEVAERGSTTPLVRDRGGVAPPNRNQQTVQSSGASVNELMLTNRSGKKLILLAGEMVVGGKQDRIVQRDGIIPSSKVPVSLNVFCVEQGRWAGSDGKFGSGGLGAGGGVAFADPTVRGAAQGSGQQQVWHEVAAKNAKSGGAAGRTTYQATLSSERNIRSLQDYKKAFDGFPMRGTVGAVVSVNGKVIWADCFIDSGLFAKYWPKLLQSYMIDAATEAPARGTGIPVPPTSSAQAFLDEQTGKSTFEGDSQVYKLTRIDGPKTLIHELADIEHGGNITVHFNKMLKK